MVKVGHETAVPSVSGQSSSLPEPELVPCCVAGARERTATALLAEAASWLSPGRIDYVSIVDADDLQPIDTVTRRALVAIAVFLPGARLIDNAVLGVG